MRIHSVNISLPVRACVCVCVWNESPLNHKMITWIDTWQRHDDDAATTYMSECHKRRHPHFVDSKLLNWMNDILNMPCQDIMEYNSKRPNQHIRLDPIHNNVNNNRIVSHMLRSIHQSHRHGNVHQLHRIVVLHTNINTNTNTHKLKTITHKNGINIWHS